MAKVLVEHITRKPEHGPADGLGLIVEYDSTTKATILIQPPQADPASEEVVRNELRRLAKALTDAANTPGAITVHPQTQA
jgi:hypothetical protein